MVCELLSPDHGLLNFPAKGGRILLPQQLGPCSKRLWLATPLLMLVSFSTWDHCLSLIVRKSCIPSQVGKGAHYTNTVVPLVTQVESAARPYQGLEVEPGKLPVFLSLGCVILISASFCLCSFLASLCSLHLLSFVHPNGPASPSLHNLVSRMSLA